MSRRRFLLAAVQASGDTTRPPESTQFSFPLYLNTEVVYQEDGYISRYREVDDISTQLTEWMNDNAVNGIIPADILQSNQIYIDGALVLGAEYDNLIYAYTLQVDNYPFNEGYSDVYITFSDSLFIDIS
ncbi:MAG: hypothetical protein IIW52_05335 [Alistipes sp.]|nr:hypothetical protein [Alistipes sp.]